MKAAPFEYFRATTLQEAADLLQSCGEGSQILAGGQSLVPALNLRLSCPSALIDINPAADSVALSQAEDVLRCGALVRHAELERSTLVRRIAPLLSLAIPHVGHIAIRNRGTPCGSVALADPSAEIPACAVALGAGIVLQSAKGSRTVAAQNYFLGLYETARQPDELVAELRFPIARPTQRFGFLELTRRHGDFAITGVAVVADVQDARIDSFRLVVFGCEPMPRLFSSAASAAEGQLWTSLSANDVADAVAADLEPMENADGDDVTKRQQTRTIVRRVIEQMRSGEIAA